MALPLFVGSEALAHGGGLNAQGRQTNGKTGDNEIPTVDVIAKRYRTCSRKSFATVWLQLLWPQSEGPAE